MKHIVSMNWVLARLYEPDLALIDCRFQLSDPNAGRLQYEQSRIPGALYLDLERHLSGPVSLHGGRHPLPDMSAIAELLGRLGVSRTSRVVAYDDQGGAMASRLWWMMRYIGHEHVYVMDEGFTSWQNAGFPITSATPPIQIPVEYEIEVQHHMLADVHDVKRAVMNPGSENTPILIDSREKQRYLGITEPIDKAAGHIPGAIHRFWKDNLHQNGKWKSVQELIERFDDIRSDSSPEGHREIIVYCGSGVTACPNVLALSEAGFEKVKLYAGSWSDWISYEGNPVATGEE